MFPSMETRFIAPAVAVQSFLAAGSTILFFRTRHTKMPPRVVKDNWHGEVKGQTVNLHRRKRMQT